VFGRKKSLRSKKVLDSCNFIIINTFFAQTCFLFVNAINVQNNNAVLNCVNGITLGLTITDSNNQMMAITENIICSR
jgi:hypothetical protein